MHHSCDHRGDGPELRSTATGTVQTVREPWCCTAALGAIQYQYSNKPRTQRGKARTPPLSMTRSNDKVAGTGGSAVLNFRHFGADGSPSSEEFKIHCNVLSPARDVLCRSVSVPDTSACGTLHTRPLAPSSRGGLPSSWPTWHDRCHGIAGPGKVRPRDWPCRSSEVKEQRQRLRRCQDRGPWCPFVRC